MTDGFTCKRNNMRPHADTAARLLVLHRFRLQTALAVPHLRSDRDFSLAAVCGLMLSRFTIFAWCDNVTLEVVQSLWFVRYSSRQLWEQSTAPAPWLRVPSAALALTA